MDTMPLICLGFLAISLVANLALAILLYRKSQKPPPITKYDIGAEELLSELLGRGRAVVRVEVIDTANLLLRSPNR
jgi:hypothetical protein